MAESEMRDDTDFGRGVVLFRERPCGDENATTSYIRVVRDLHTALIQPAFTTPGGVVELAVWTLWAPTSHDTHMDKAMTSPAVFPNGMKRLSFEGLKNQDSDALQYFDVCAYLSLQSLVDMQIAGMHVTYDDRDTLILDMIYVMAIEIGIAFFDKSCDDPRHATSQMMQLRPYMERHAALMKNSNIDRSQLLTFRNETQQAAQSLCCTALHMKGTEIVEDSLRVLAMSGIACVSRIYGIESSLYAGLPLASDGERKVKIVSAYASVITALDANESHDFLIRSFLMLLLKGENCVPKMLNLHAHILNPKTRCCLCNEVLSHVKISTGSCHLCPVRERIACERCVPTAMSCVDCQEHAKKCDYESVAVDAVARSLILLRCHTRTQKLYAAEKEARETHEKKLQKAEIDKADAERAVQDKARAIDELKGEVRDLKKERRRTKKNSAPPDADALSSLQKRCLDLECALNDAQANDAQANDAQAQNARTSCKKETCATQTVEEVSSLMPDFRATRDGYAAGKEDIKDAMIEKLLVMLQKTNADVTVEAAD